MRSRRQKRRQLRGSGNNPEGPLSDAKESLLEALQMCQLEVIRLGQFTTEGRAQVRRTRKISAAIALIEEAKGPKTLPGDPDLVSEEEAARRAQLRREEREKAKAKAAAAKAAASPSEA